MNPRHRRLLIPGLLVALLIVVLVASLARRADGATSEPTIVSHLDDPRIAESSGLALSRTHEGIAYTMNDSDNAPYVFAIELSSGRTVGVTRIERTALRDTEAIAIDGDGTLWLADTGDNRGTRTDAALYALPEPGIGDRVVTARRYPITYDGGPQNVEALLVDPVTGAKHLVGKGLLGGTVFALPERLAEDGDNRATALDGSAPPLVTDGSASDDGSRVVLRNYAKAYLIDPADWSVLREVDLPDQPQGESIAIEASARSVLIGSEGADSAIIRVPVDLTIPAHQTPPTPPATSASTDPDSAESGLWGSPVFVGLGAAVAVVALVAGVALGLRRSS